MMRFAPSLQRTSLSLSPCGWSSTTPTRLFVACTGSRSMGLSGRQARLPGVVASLNGLADKQRERNPINDRLVSLRTSPPSPSLFFLFIIILFSPLLLLSLFISLLSLSLSLFSASLHLSLSSSLSVSLSLSLSLSLALSLALSFVRDLARALSLALPLALSLARAHVRALSLSTSLDISPLLLPSPHDFRGRMWASFFEGEETADDSDVCLGEDN